MTPNADAVWSAAQELLRGMLKAEIYALWFAPIRLEEVQGETLYLGVRDEFCEVWLRENYLDLLRSVVSRAAVRPMQVEFRVIQDGYTGKEKQVGEMGVESNAEDFAGAKNKPLAAWNEDSNETLDHVGERVAGKNSQGSLKKESGISEGWNPHGAGQDHAENRGMISNGVSTGRQSQCDIETFNAQNTFETFVVGNNNQFAHSAALAVAQNPGKAFNPLFLFGGVGLVKTHLLQAIGHHVHSTRRNPKIAYLSCEKFTNEFIDALQNNSLMKFRRRYRQVDVLLVDDIQFLIGKERIQEEFFHTFNTLHDARKQIVLTCDRPANEIKGLEERLISRFEWGQTADMQAPDVETRVAILRKKSKMLGLEIGADLIDFLATRIRTNIRRLEGAFVRVASYGQLTGRPVTLEIVETLLREILEEEGNQTVTVELIQRRVAEHYDIRMADMTSKRRPENIAFPRQVAMYLSRRLTEHSLSAIGEAFGGRDHGTVLHACRQVRDRMEVDEVIRQKVSYLERQLTR